MAKTNTAKLDDAAILEDIEVLEVSFVDRPANQRPFLIRKAASGDQVPPDDVTTPGTINPTAPTEPAIPAGTPPVVDPPKPQSPPAGEPPPAPAVVEKKGAKMARPRLDRLIGDVDALDQTASRLKALIDELRPIAAATPEDGTTVDFFEAREITEDPLLAEAVRTETAKRATVESALATEIAKRGGVEQELDALRRQLVDKDATIAAQAAVIAKARGQGGASNASEVDGPAAVPVRKHVFPADLNAKRREAANRRFRPVVTP